jgi:hypothetical protein
MYNIISIFNSELPVFKLFELYTQYDEHFDEKTKSKTRNTYIILLLVFKILIWVYAFYLLYKCLSQRSASGEYVNSVCEIVVMVCCLPCWLIYRTFINRCTTVIPNVNLYESNPVPGESSQLQSEPSQSEPPQSLSEPSQSQPIPPQATPPPPQQVQSPQQVQQSPQPQQTPPSTLSQPTPPQQPITNNVSEVSPMANTEPPMLNTTVQESTQMPTQMPTQAPTQMPTQMPTPTEVTTNMPTTGGKKRGRPAKVVKSKKVNL